MLLFKSISQWLGRREICLLYECGYKKYFKLLCMISVVVGRCNIIQIPMIIKTTTKKRAFFVFELTCKTKQYTKCFISFICPKNNLNIYYFLCLLSIVFSIWWRLYIYLFHYYSYEGRNPHVCTIFIKDGHVETGYFRSTLCIISVHKYKWNSHV